jgi:hypothetical protein
MNPCTALCSSSQQYGSPLPRVDGQTLRTTEKKTPFPVLVGDFVFNSLGTICRKNPDEIFTKPNSELQVANLQNMRKVDR